MKSWEKLATVRIRNTVAKTVPSQDRTALPAQTKKRPQGQTASILLSKNTRNRKILLFKSQQG